MSWIRTISGKRFDLVAPKPDSICIEDIGRALSHICRYTGHLRTMYSVAQHSVLVSQIVQPRLALEALLHDASEAYCNDISSPLKKLLPDYRAIEERIQSAINKRFQINTVHKYEIKRADLILLQTEMRDLGDFSDDEKPDAILYPPLEVRIIPLSSDDAMQLFINRYIDIINS